MIHFYINQSNTPYALEEHILSLTGDIYIHCNNFDHANKISEFLWSYPDRFIPNQISETLIPHIISIGYTNIPTCKHIINTSDQLLDIPHIEWVSSNLEAARARYKTYKARHYKLETHML